MALKNKKASKVLFDFSGSLMLLDAIKKPPLRRRGGNYRAFQRACDSRMTSFASAISPHLVT